MLSHVVNITVSVNYGYDFDDNDRKYKRLHFICLTQTHLPITIDWTHSYTVGL